MQTPINLCNVYNPEGSVTLNINMVVRPCFLLRDYITAMAKKAFSCCCFLCRDCTHFKTRVCGHSLRTNFLRSFFGVGVPYCDGHNAFLGKRFVFKAPLRLKRP
jgi:hypothetical protein